MEIEKFKQILRDNKVSVTQARLDIFTTLLKNSIPLKKAEIATLTLSVNRASIYRTLELFDRLSITSTLVRGWTPFVELAEPFKSHHHHLQCTHCQQLSRLDSSELEQLVDHIALTHGYKMISHHIELLGLCSSCQGLLDEAPLAT